MFVSKSPESEDFHEINQLIQLTQKSSSHERNIAHSVEARKKILKYLREQLV